MSNFIMSDAKVSPKWKLNVADLKKIAIYTAKFFSIPIVMYLGQLVSTNTSASGFTALKDLVPNTVTLGGIYGWALGIALNFFLKLNDGSSK